MTVGGALLRDGLDGLDGVRGRSRQAERCLGQAGRTAAIRRSPPLVPPAHGGREAVTRRPSPFPDPNARRCVANRATTARARRIRGPEGPRRDDRCSPSNYLMAGAQDVWPPSSRKRAPELLAAHRSPEWTLVTRWRANVPILLLAATADRLVPADQVASCCHSAKTSSCAGSTPPTSCCRLPESLHSSRRRCNSWVDLVDPPWQDDLPAP
jgi:hypothetical protein